MKGYKLKLYLTLYSDLCISHLQNHGIEEKVSVGNNRVTIANADGVLMVEVKDGEISVQDFDGEVIVKNMEMVKE